MSEYFAGGHLRFVDGEWRDDDGNMIEISTVRHGRWEWSKDYDGDSILVCSECGRVCHEEDAPYCYCGCKMDLEAADA